VADSPMWRWCQRRAPNLLAMEIAGLGSHLCTPGAGRLVQPHQLPGGQSELRPAALTNSADWRTALVPQQLGWSR
jgi:hypothetical protein